MLNNGCFEYDSANRLIKATDLTYTYNAEDVRIRSFGEYVDTTYTYNTNCKLSQLLTKTTNGITTKYVYGLGLIGEEKEGCFKTYHFDYRGSTVAITDECGNIIDTLKYDTYGNVTEHIGDSYVIFGYNGRDGVITDRNGLLYMRARYYSPAIRRFINADILHGEISDSTSLNRYSYVNGNPVSFVDPFGLSKERGVSSNYSNNKRVYNLLNEIIFGVSSAYSFVNNEIIGGGLFKRFLDYFKEVLFSPSNKIKTYPTVLEAAYMARHIYTINDKEQSELIGGWQYEKDKLITGGDGMVMGVYSRVDENGNTGYALVNRGTVSWYLNDSDIYNNFLQPFGFSNDMWASIKFAKDFVNNNPDSTITFIGHSKGGAEAAANAVATNRDAILFNPATVSLEAYGLSAKNYNADMTAYIVEGEILNNIFGWMSEPIDSVEYLPNQGGSAGYNHKIHTVISALIEEGYK